MAQHDPILMNDGSVHTATKVRHSALARTRVPKENKASASPPYARGVQWSSPVRHMPAQGQGFSGVKDPQRARRGSRQCIAGQEAEEVVLPTTDVPKQAHCRVHRLSKTIHSAPSHQAGATPLRQSAVCQRPGHSDFVPSWLRRTVQTRRYNHQSAFCRRAFAGAAVPCVFWDTHGDAAKPVPDLVAHPMLRQADCHNRASFNDGVAPCCTTRGLTYRGAQEP